MTATNRKKRPGGYIPELDGWRVLLIFIVSWYHIWQQSWLTPHVGKTSLDFLVRTGYMPVDATILLSGFLLFLPYANAMKEHGAVPSARGFYRKRITRIWPSYAVFTLLMLFVNALPTGAYQSTGDMWRDLIAHFTFTFTWFRPTYLSTPLGAASWTICIEVQFYLLFPWLARLAVKKPAAVLLGMCAVAFQFRMWALWRFTAYNMVVNQMISFLDVYAVGMALAIAYVHLKEVYAGLRRKWPVQIAALAVFALGIWGITVMLRHQAVSSGYDGLQAGQMMRRLPFALMAGACMFSLPFLPPPGRLLFGNPVTRFLSTISMNYYLVHHPVAVILKQLHWPWSDYYDWDWCVAHDITDKYGLPNQAGDKAWMLPYVLACFGISLAVATVLTFAVEKPAAFGLRKLFARIDRKHEQKTLLKASLEQKTVPPAEPQEEQQE